jgi:myo-inositol-1(or 4)-monophosphatase
LAYIERRLSCTASQRTAFYGFWGRNASEHATSGQVPVAWAQKSRKMQGFMPLEEDRQHALQAAERIAQEAGRLIMGGWRNGGKVSHKGRFDLLTDHDLASERLIRERLENEFPSHRIVGEESPETGEGEMVWYVDPIDGTTNFVHGHFFFSVSIALCRGSEGLVGVVHAPALGVTWKAAKGGGAFRNGQRCSVSTRATLEEALCATGFPYDRWSNPDNNVAELELFLQRARGIRRCGSASIDLCLVADGTYDIYWEQRLNAWDVCAGAVVVLEAGGQLTAYDGGPADPRTGRLIASNRLLHDAAVRTVREARNKLAPGRP